jgi:hypothetical protein
MFCEASALEQRAQRHARPLRIADRSELPLCPLHLIGMEACVGAVRVPPDADPVASTR